MRTEWGFCILREEFAVLMVFCGVDGVVEKDGFQ